MTPQPDIVPSGLAPRAPRCEWCDAELAPAMVSARGFCRNCGAPASKYASLREWALPNEPVAWRLE